MEAQMQTITGIVSEGLGVLPTSHVSDGPRHRPLAARDRARAATDILDRTYEGLLGPDVHTAMNRLRASLSVLRRCLPADEWDAFGADARRHPVHSLLLESPFTRRAYSKPRGYAGDAVLMDLIYGKARPAEDLSALGGIL